MTFTSRNVTSNFATGDTDRFKIFLQNIETEERTLLNNSGAVKSYATGTVMAVIGASNRLVPFDPAGSDGSQFPVGVLMQDVEDLADNGTTLVNIAIEGEVDQDRLVFDPDTTTLTTNVSGRTVRDLIKASTAGIRPVEVQNNNFFDN